MFDSKKCQRKNKYIDEDLICSQLKTKPECTRESNEEKESVHERKNVNKHKTCS